MSNTHPTWQRRGRIALTAVAAAAALVACGGGDNGPVLQSGSDVPQSAANSPGEAFAFVLGLQANTGDTNSPIVVNDATLSTDDTSEPNTL